MVMVMGMGSLWVYGGGYGFGPDLCCVAVGLWAYGFCSRSMGGWWWKFVFGVILVVADSMFVAEYG